jgi:glycosyltransferase involved in cell wall biosynthesis
MDVSLKKKKVLILYNNLFHYRIPIFRLLAEKYDLTVAYSMGSDSKEQLNFKVEKLPVIKINRFVIHKNNIFRLCQNFDAVIAYGDIAWLKISMLPFYKKRRFKLILWTIGVSASYNKAFDSVKKWDSVRDFFYKKADALIFYTDYPIKKYIERGFLKEKMFVAPNTVEVLKNDQTEITKDSILFIGTLYMQKGLLLLLENYKLAFLQNSNIPVLNIVGGGDEFGNVRDWISSNNLVDKIILHGPVFDIDIKSNFFERAFACISPNQAGLSVLESMGYGVPFVTQKDSITGGERLNIIQNENGILYNNHHELEDIILEITSNPQKYIKMGKNARDFYMKYRKPTDMANGLVNAVEYVTM